MTTETRFDIPDEIISSAQRSADIWEQPMCIGRRRETRETSRGDELLIRKYGNHGELGVYLVVLPNTYWLGECAIERDRR